MAGKFRVIAVANSENSNKTHPISRRRVYYDHIGMHITKLFTPEISLPYYVVVRHSERREEELLVRSFSRRPTASGTQKP